MKITFEPQAYKIVKGTILLIAVVMVTYIAYAATNLSVSNSGTVTIAAQNIQGITFNPTSPAPTCATQTTYSNTPSPIVWGNIAQSNSATGYICVKNLGGTGATYFVQTTVPPSSSGITITFNGTSTLTSTPLLTGQTSLVNVVVSVALGASLGPFSYTTTIS